MRVACAVLLATALLTWGVCYADPAAKPTAAIAPTAVPAAPAAKGTAPVAPASPTSTAKGPTPVAPASPAPTAKAPAPTVPAAKAPASPAATAPEPPLPPLKGSHFPSAKYQCIECHCDPDFGAAQPEKYLPREQLKKDIHFSKGVTCVDCHGGDYTTDDQNRAHSDPHFRGKFAAIKRYCAACHEKQVTVLAASPHKDASCIECHAKADQGKILPHTISADMKEKLADDVGFCGKCHAKELVKLSQSVHSKAGKDPLGQLRILSCSECHGKPGHDMLPVQNERSPVFLGHQVETCGRCHSGAEHNWRKETYQQSVHGQRVADWKPGMDKPAVCADCHDAHGIYDYTDPEATLNVVNVANTCATRCHNKPLKDQLTKPLKDQLTIKQQLLASVHGRGTGPGGRADRPAPGGKRRDRPTCTSCHRGHALGTPHSLAFREALPDLCGNCHTDMSSLFGLSMHGKLTDLGYGPAAKCADCHGSHNIRALDDPESALSPANRVQTCGKCHRTANKNFAQFNPHLDPFDAKRYPVVNGVQITLLTLLFATFGFFGVHSLLWFIRGMVEVVKHGRPHGLRPGETAYVRFATIHRIGHSIMMISFLGLALTGLPLKYHQADWAKWLARYMGGFPCTSVLHRVFGVVLLASMAAYLARMVWLLVRGRKQGRTLKDLIFGDDSPMPTLQDLKDFLKMLRWFFGLGPRPGFNRWSYWEKIDFWGAIADTVIIGSTGLVLWFPSVFCAVLPGSALNIAQVVHSTQALLATGFVFAIHFFNTHCRPDRFPADMSVLTGLVSEEEFKEDRPEYFQRLEREGKLEALRTASPGLAVLWGIRIFGFAALAVGLALLVGMIVASLG